MENWFHPYIKEILEKRNNRDIVFWGKYWLSEKISEHLKTEYNIPTVFWVDKNPKKQVLNKVFPTEKLKEKSNDFFVVVFTRNSTEIQMNLKSFGYSETDYFLLPQNHIIKANDNYYEDAYGNIIIGKRGGLIFTFYGFNSTIDIGDNINFENMNIKVYNNAEIHIGDNDSQNLSRFEDIDMIVYNNSYFVIKDAFLIRKSEIFVGDYAKVSIGHGFTLRRSIIAAQGGTTLNIGDDCMFSHHINIYTNDGHSIFDVNTQKNTSSSKEILKTRKINIGNHVWCGMCSTILYNTNIGDGSIIGANSLVKNEFPNNVMIAGTPAKIIKKDIAWSRNYMSDDISDCGIYANKTIE